MITRASAFLDRKIIDGQLTDDQRSRVLIDLCQSRRSIEDIAEALNCSESMVRSLLARPFRSLYAPNEGSDACTAEPLNLRMVPRTECAVISNSAPTSQEEVARLRERSAHQLAMEVRDWLCSFEASDRDRQQAVEQAGLILDESPLTADGQYQFEVSRVFAELRGIWSGYHSTSADYNFGKAVSPWLASWIRFWIADPIVWDRALDLEYAHFLAKARAA